MGKKEKGAENVAGVTGKDTRVCTYKYTESIWHITSHCILAHSIKRELDKATNEKNEIHRHYIMVRVQWYMFMYCTPSVCEMFVFSYSIMKCHMD